MVSKGAKRYEKQDSGGNWKTSLFCPQKKGYTQEQLANLTDLSIKMISAAENGHKAMRPENIIKICECLSISTDYLLRGESKNLSTIVEYSEIKRLTPRQKQALTKIIEDFLSAFYMFYMEGYF